MYTDTQPAGCSSCDMTSVVYGDVFLYDSDIALFEGNEWLNDACINYYYEFLSKQYSITTDDILLVQPATVFILTLLPPDAARSTLESLKFFHQTLICLPINDSSNTEGGGGSHWGLLVIHMGAKKCLYIDSMGRGNVSIAQSLYSRLATGFPDQMGGFAFVILDGVPQQTNYYDCGMYVLVNTEAVLQLYQEKECLREDAVGAVVEVERALSQRVSSTTVSEKRRQIGAELRALQQQQQQQKQKS